MAAASSRPSSPKPLSVTTISPLIVTQPRTSRALVRPCRVKGCTARSCRRSSDESPDDILDMRADTETTAYIRKVARTAVIGPSTRCQTTSGLQEDGCQRCSGTGGVR